MQAMAEGGGTIACRGACAKLMQAAPARVPAEATNRIAGTCEGIGRITLRVASKGLAKKKPDALALPSRDAVLLALAR